MSNLRARCHCLLSGRWGLGDLTSSLTVEPTSVLLLKGLLPWKESLLPGSPVGPHPFPCQFLLPSETLTWSFTGTKVLVRVTIRKCTRRKWASLAKGIFPSPQNLSFFHLSSRNNCIKVTYDSVGQGVLKFFEIFDRLPKYQF